MTLSNLSKLIEERVRQKLLLLCRKQTIIGQLPCDSAEIALSSQRKDLRKFLC